MPRKKLIYTHEYPYHVTARSNNREWFYLSKPKVWKIFVNQLNLSIKKHSIIIHAFVLMDNHYHLILSTDSKFDLGVVMRDFQRSVSRRINSESNRINHVFGGPYKGSLIDNQEYFSNVLKYVLSNPVEAQICDNAEDYRFSTIHNREEIPLTSLLNSFYSIIPTGEDFLLWVNEKFDDKYNESIKLGLRKAVYKPTSRRNY